MDTKEYIKSNLVYSNHLYLIETIHNGPILHCLFDSLAIKKQVHVDFIFANEDEYESNLMYLAYNDFSGILGVIARKLKFNYGSRGFYKIYIDKKGQYHYILLSRNLYHGLKMLGYGDIIHKYEYIETIDDIAAFLSSTDLFDSTMLQGSDLNRGDRKRMRAGRPTARYLRDTLTALNKHRIQMDDDYYVKTLYPNVYEKYLQESKAIEEYVPIKSKYNGHWIIQQFHLQPGPLIGKIQLYWTNLYKDQVDSVDERELFNVTKQYIDTLQKR